MNAVREIIYLDEARLASFVSQRQGYVEEFRTQADGAERSSQLVEETASTGALSRQTASLQAILRHGRSLDARWTQFLDGLGERVVALGGDLDVKNASEDALERGALVRATGVFFIDDFGWLNARLAQMPELIRAQEYQQLAVLTAALAGLETTKASGAQRQQLKAQIAAVSAQAKAQLETYQGQQKLIAALYGDAVEGGVVLHGSPPVEVRGVLDRTWLREPGPTLIERYGSRSKIGFTVVGLVTRLSWSERSHLSAHEQAAWQAVGQQPTTGQPLNVAAASMRSMVGAAQAIVENLRNLAGVRSEGATVFVFPLAIYRPVAI
jgi:hypothetical protein